MAECEATGPQLMTVYKLEYLCENCRDKLRSYSTQAIIKSRGDSSEKDRKICIICYMCVPLPLAA